MLMTLAWAAPAQAEQHLDIRLVAETLHPAAGSTVTLALDTRPQAGWHGYWSNPGDAGFPARYEWTLPKGVTADEPRYPAPQPLKIAGLMNYVFEKPYAPLVTLHVPAGLAAGTALPVKLHLGYLVCTDALCVPEDADLSLDLTIGDGAIAPETAARFDAWRRALPRPLGSDATYAVENGVVRIALPYPAGEPIAGAWFFPSKANEIDNAADQTVHRDGDRLILETKVAQSQSGPIDGVLKIGDRALDVHAVAGAIPSAEPIWRTALLAFLGAVLGGLILNVMPCVFPILSLKALALARAGNPGEARREGLAYAGGAILACVVLGVVILVLRASGEAAGWAFQLQSPRMILVLLLLVWAIALNLAGLFTLPVPQFAQRSGGGAFATGALAAFVATPCTGPFMGAALGAALVLPWGAALAVFAGLGLGLALPFLVLGFVPALQRRLPKPGLWMERLQRILSVPMFLTAAALAWVLWRQAGETGLWIGLAAAAAIGLAVWKPNALLSGGALALCVAGIVLVTPAHSAASHTAFSEARLAELRAAHKPVLVYFTADWCLTCKVNEANAIGPATPALAAKGVTILEGDWTNGDPAISRFLDAHGRAGVPFYLFYPASGGEPVVLPQVLTKSALEKLA